LRGPATRPICSSWLENPHSSPEACEEASPAKRPRHDAQPRGRELGPSPGLLLNKTQTRPRLVARAMRLDLSQMKRSRHKLSRRWAGKALTCHAARRTGSGLSQGSPPQRKPWPCWSASQPGHAILGPTRSPPPRWALPSPSFRVRVCCLSMACMVLYRTRTLWVDLARWAGMHGAGRRWLRAAEKLRCVRAAANGGSFPRLGSRGASGATVTPC
jgi:hypothetical protein